MRKRKIISIIVLLLCMGIMYLHADTIIDTTYSVPEMDGCIDYNTYWNTYYVDILSSLLAGDFWDWYNGGNCYVRSFVSIPLPEGPDGYELDSAYIYIYQSASFGNSVPDVFPIWDMTSGSYEVPCYVDHVDYGYTLDIGDFNSFVLENCIGIISETPEDGWRNLKLLNMYKRIFRNNENTPNTAYVFPINTDYDDLDDLLLYGSGENTAGYKPYIRFIFTINNPIDEVYPSSVNGLVSIYPNPVRDNFTIVFENPKQKRMQISLYNVRGERIKSICTNSVSNSFTIGTDNVPSGVYFMRIDNEDVTLTRKILVIK